MPELDPVIARLEKRSLQADEMIALLRKQIVEVRKVALVKNFTVEAERLNRENEQMKLDIEMLKNRLIQLETKQGIPQIGLPLQKPAENVVPEQQPVTRGGSVEKILTQRDEKTPKESGQPEKGPKAVSKQAKKDPGPKPGAKAEPKEDEQEPDVSRLDLRIGLIVSAKKHPDADSLYVEDVDVGEGKNRTVVSGLVRFVPLDQMQNRLAVLLCNLKPAKMRGVTSEAMVMCASTPEKVEILVPPTGAVPGDKVVCEGFSSATPDKELNPKKKIFERIAPHLKTDANRVATYKGQPLSVPGKGLIVAPTLTDVQIK